MGEEGLIWVLKTLVVWRASDGCEWGGMRVEEDPELFWMA